MGWIAETWRGIMAPEPIDEGGASWGKPRAGSVGEMLASAKPRLAAVTRAPSREAFDAWREHPVTLFVFQALNAVAEEQEKSWHSQSWHGGICDPLVLNGLRARADAYTSIQDGDYEAYCEWIGVEPDGESAAA